jgi:hypothetical protein
MCQQRGGQFRDRLYNLRGRRCQFMLQRPERVFRRITTTVCLRRAQTSDGNLRISSRRRLVASLARCPKGHTASQAPKHVHASQRLAASEDEACHSHGYKQQTPRHGGWPLFASCGSSMHLPPFPITCPVTFSHLSSSLMPVSPCPFLDPSATPPPAKSGRESSLDFSGSPPSPQLPTRRPLSRHLSPQCSDVFCTAEQG